MCSTPPPITTSWTPAAICEAARLTACWAEPHWQVDRRRRGLDREVLLEPGVASRREAPAGRTAATQPAITFSTSAGIDPGALDHRAVRRAEQLVRVGVLVVALLRVSAPDRGTGCLDDHNLAATFSRHSPLLVMLSRNRSRRRIGGALKSGITYCTPATRERLPLAGTGQEETPCRNDWESRARARSPAASRQPRRRTARSCCGPARPSRPSARTRRSHATAPSCWEARSILSNVRIVTDLDGLDSATFLVEAVVEHHGHEVRDPRRARRALAARRRRRGAGHDDLVAVDLRARAGERAPGAVRRLSPVQPGAADEAGRARVPARGHRARRASGRGASPRRSARRRSRFRTPRGSSSTGCCSRICSAPSS